MIEKKVNTLLSRLSELEDQLGHSEVFNDQKKYRELTQEHAYLTELKSLWEQFQRTQVEIRDSQNMLKEEKEDLEFAQAIRDDIQNLETRLATLEKKIHDHLIPPDPMDNCNTIIEIRAGTGGDEAALFVGDCVRMYQLYAARKEWRYELLSCTPSEIGGYKEYIMVLSGAGVHRFMQYEAGTHRVQRVPDTEAQGRVHTSAVTVAVLAEPDESVEVNIVDKDLRVDTYRSSGAGGQHVNTTDSAVRLTHLPTGIVVYCQEERSQHKNKEKALRLLKAKILEVDIEKKRSEIANTRAAQIGSGDRSERIRTYNFPQNRLTDHRINLTKYNLDQIMQGDLEDVTSALVSHYHQEQFSEE